MFPENIYKNRTFRKICIYKNRTFRIFSIGVGDTSLDITACYQHMLNLCSNLHSETISTVRHQLDNLKSHVMPPVDGKVEEKNFFENFLEIF